jgi:hypothetical protein
VCGDGLVAAVEAKQGIPTYRKGAGAEEEEEEEEEEVSVSITQNQKGA